MKKTALGAEDSVSWSHFANATDAIADLRERNYRVYAIEQVENSTYLHDLIWTTDEPIAIVFGNEVTGVEQTTIALCDGCIEIPQLGMKHSLNIATAAGVVLWELVSRIIKKKQMSTAKKYLSLIKFSHTIFAMPFAIIGFFWE
ncbi:TrmH family RNA methyltransferase [Niabella hibiscisoli]|uniref:TrmH family RNA methyltransferase n=1 Tax=Niabella hibiscisoli TaxID=1825928 RepID=UPI001F0DFBF1|nr:TrmH family RNA methyltransferase [Niabella hibiscisoli]MCH5721206.1 hypothetical protein [Niabella hibiscisoli]